MQSQASADLTRTFLVILIIAADRGAVDPAVPRRIDLAPRSS
jgi:hypothetical protein